MVRIRKSVVALALVSISVTPAAFGQAIGAATDNAPSPSAANRLPRTLFISAPRGGTVRLIYVPDDGWSFANGAIGSKAAMAALTPTEKPLAVFIDGPTGFTYVWIGETGWKFVGRIVDERR